MNLRVEIIKLLDCSLDDDLTCLLGFLFISFERRLIQSLLEVGHHSVLPANPDQSGHVETQRLSDEEEPDKYF